MSDSTMCHLSDEVLVHIFSFLPAEDIGRAAGVCSRWAQVAEDWRVWQDKSYLSEGACGLSDALPVARALPTLKNVTVRKGNTIKVYMSGESAEFEVPDLRGEAATSAISSLVTEKLSLDFLLVEETSVNCLVVQLHRLKQLHVTADPNWLPRRATMGKLRAITGALSREPLPNLQSVDVRTGTYLDKNIESDILGTLATCPALTRLSLCTHCFLSWQAVDKFSRLQFLQLQNCTIEDTSFFDLCPNLRSLSLVDCRPLKWRELSQTLELRHLVLRELQVDLEFLDKLYRSCPELESIAARYCTRFDPALLLKHCRRLITMEVDTFSCTFPNVTGPPFELRQLKLTSPDVTSDELAEIVKHLPRLETLSVIYLECRSLSFLRHCTGLVELSMGLMHYNKFEHFHELRGLKSLKKLCLFYEDDDLGPLAEALQKMPQLEALNVKFRNTVSNLSLLRHCHWLRSLILQFDEVLFTDPPEMLSECFLDVEVLGGILAGMPHLEELDIGFADKVCDFSFLRNCRQLTSVQISHIGVCVWDFKELRCLEELRRLTLMGLSEMPFFREHLPLLVEEVLRMPQLEYLALERDGPNVLESWEWRRMFTSLSSKGRE